MTNTAGFPSCQRTGEPDALILWMSRANEGDEDGFPSDAGAKAATQHTIQTDLVNELTWANSRRDVSSCSRRAQRRLAKTPLNMRLFLNATHGHAGIGKEDAWAEPKGEISLWFDESTATLTGLYCDYVGSYPSLAASVLLLADRSTSWGRSCVPAWLRLPFIWRHAGERINWWVFINTTLTVTHLHKQAHVRRFLKSWTEAAASTYKRWKVKGWKTLCALRYTLNQMDMVRENSPSDPSHTSQ